MSKIQQERKHTLRKSENKIQRDRRNTHRESENKLQQDRRHALWESEKKIQQGGIPLGIREKMQQVRGHTLKSK